MFKNFGWVILFCTIIIGMLILYECKNIPVNQILPRHLSGQGRQEPIPSAEKIFQISIT